MEKYRAYCRDFNGLGEHHGVLWRTMECCGEAWSPQKPYKGIGQAVTDVIGGQIPMLSANATAQSWTSIAPARSASSR